MSTFDPSIARFSVEKYQRLIDVGILGKYDKVELLEGYITLKLPRSPKHDATCQLIGGTLSGLDAVGWTVRPGLSLVLADSEPEPDFAVVRGASRGYLARHPGPDDTALVIEVAESSLARDRDDKARIYARAAIPAYWVVNLVDGTVEVYTLPSGPVPAPHYASRQTVRPPDAVPLTLDGASIGPIPATDLLP
jgi:Uma2 family endonuclease